MKNFSLKVYAILGMMLSSLATAFAAEPLSVRGTVTDASDNEPLIGATIAVKNRPGVGTATDIDGSFTLKVEMGAKLVISYIGYDTKTVEVTSPTINVALTSSTQTLDDVVVIGYGTAKKSDLTGAVASVGGEKIRTQPTSSLANALQARQPA